MIKATYGKENFLKEFGHEIAEDEYFLFKTSGTEGNQKEILIKKNILIDNFNLYIKSLDIKIDEKILITSKISIDHPYAFGLFTVIEDIIFFESIKEKISKINKMDVIFTTPSFFINFKDFIKVNKKQKIIFTGEEMPSFLKEELIDFNVYQSFGMSEALNIAVKKINEKNYNFISENIKIDSDNYLYSPYLCSYIIENNHIKQIKNKYLLTDKVILENNGFSFLERSSFIAKINDERISINEISNFLFSKNDIKDLIMFKNKKNELDMINLFYVSNIEVEKIKEMILNKFNNINYLPNNIIKVEKIPINDFGKKDILKLINDYKI
jgi:hypothetical protein